MTADEKLTDAQKAELDKIAARHTRQFYPQGVVFTSGVTWIECAILGDDPSIRCGWYWTPAQAVRGAVVLLAAASAAGWSFNPLLLEILGTFAAGQLPLMIGRRVACRPAGKDQRVPLITAVHSTNQADGFPAIPLPKPALWTMGDADRYPNAEAVMFVSAAWNVVAFEAAKAGLSGAFCRMSPGEALAVALSLIATAYVTDPASVAGLDSALRDVRSDALPDGLLQQHVVDGTRDFVRIGVAADSQRGLPLTNLQMWWEKNLPLADEAQA